MILSDLTLTDEKRFSNCFLKIKRTSGKTGSP